MRGIITYRRTAMFLAIGMTLSLTCLQRSTLATPPQKEKGKPKYTNRLAKETSPYLLMHAHNPVDWYPWGPEAFAKAKKEGKLIFLSIGYSSCYWCHVMERESFNNPEVAKLMNEWFVSIKVDREERPDIDNIYMTALNSLGQNGGWPLSMFLTADGRPIIGGTYWPPEDKTTANGVKFRGFKSVLKLVHDVYKENPKEIEEQATRLAKLTKSSLEGPLRFGLAKLDGKLVTAAVDGLQEEFDPVYGGFGSPENKFQGPKFPTPCRLELLLHEGQRNNDKKLIEMVTLTLDKMARGGIYDQLGGGFHRYSTERTWTVPHFEKMLYDNAQLLEVYAKAYSLTKKPLYQRILRGTMDYLTREMMSPEGAIYSSQDAETDEEEGRFYVWTNAELAAALPNKKDLQLVKRVYGAGGEPNFEQKYHILCLPEPLAETAKDLKLTESELRTKLKPLKRKLFDVRSRREKPFLNKIALTAWSGLTIAGMAEVGNALDEPRYINLAKKAADFLLEKQVTKEGRLLRTYGAQPGKKPKAAVNGYLEDYSFLVHGLLTLHDVTGEKRWLEQAEKLTKTMIEHHGDEKEGGYYFTAHDHEELFARSKDQFDGATPCGNSLALRNLMRLWKKTGNEFYQKEAERGFQAFANSMDQYPTGLTTMIHALSMYVDEKNEKPQKKLPVKPLSLPGSNGKKKVPVQPVQIKVSAGKINEKGEQKITISVQIKEGWHIYANPVGNADLAGGKTTVKVFGKKNPKLLRVKYAPGRLVEDSVVGEYSVYEGKVVITAWVQRATENRQPIDIGIRFQACNQNTCLLPKTLKKTVP